MNREEINQADADAKLRRTLRSWKVTGSLPPRFVENVWQRIAREESAGPASAWAMAERWLSRALSRPAWATGCVASLLVAGSLAGYWQAREESARTNRTMEARYVQMLASYEHAPH
jgi:hypothetical protein